VRLIDTNKLPNGFVGYKLPLQDEDHGKHGSSPIKTLCVPEVILRMGRKVGDVKVWAVPADKFLDDPGQAIVPFLDASQGFVHWFLNTSAIKR
jgi:hypothetical protein